MEEIKNSLSSLGISGMTLSEVKCPTDEKILSRAVQLPYYIQKTKIEIAINDDKVEQLVNILSKGDADSNITADKICILDIKDSIRIRTGEIGEDAL